MTDPEPDEKLLVLITYPEDTDTDAESFARTLVDRDLAACVNVLDEVRSFFQWEGNLEEANENLLIAKTTRGVYSSLEAYVSEHHPYDEPEVIGLSLSEGSASYLSWIQECLE